MEDFSRTQQRADAPFSYPNQQDTSYRDFWDEALDRKGPFSGAPFVDPDFRSFTEQMAEEEFFDAAKVLDGKLNIFDMKFATNLDLDKSGIRDDGQVPRTDSISPFDSDCVSVNRYFQRRSAYSCDPALDGSQDHLHFLTQTGRKECDYDGQEVKHRRSTLTKHDLLDIIDANDANRVRKNRGPSSVCSTTSSVRSSIGTIAALEELDRILHEDSSEEEGENSPPPPSVPSRKSFPAAKNPSSHHSSHNGFFSHYQMDPRREKIPNHSHIAVPKIARHQLPAAKPAVDDVIRSYVNSQPAAKEILQQPVVRNDFNKPFEINSRAVEMLDRFLKLDLAESYSEQQTTSKEKFHRSSLPSQSSRGEEPGSRTVRKPSLTAMRNIKSDSKTEEILRRANSVLARVERMKTEEASEELHPASRKPNFSQQIENCKRPQAPPLREPLSAAQGKKTSSLVTSRHIQTETETSHTHNNSTSDMSCEASLLEQTTYPLARSSQDARDVVLATHRIFFPPTEVGESSSAKLQIKNYTAIPHLLRFGFTRESSVFQNRYDNLTIQPKRYLNVPLRFTPNATGYFETKVKIQVDGPVRKEMTVDILGEGIPRLNY